MYVDTLSGSTVSMLNRFMSHKEEEYMIISDRFCIIGDNKEFYILKLPISQMGLVP